MTDARLQSERSTRHAPADGWPPAIGVVSISPRDAAPGPILIYRDKSGRMASGQRRARDGLARRLFQGMAPACQKMSPPRHMVPPSVSPHPPAAPIGRGGRVSRRLGASRRISPGAARLLLLSALSAGTGASQLSRRERKTDAPVRTLIKKYPRFGAFQRPAICCAEFLRARALRPPLRPSVNCKISGEPSGEC